MNDYEGRGLTPKQELSKRPAQIGTICVPNFKV